MYTGLTRTEHWCRGETAAAGVVEIYIYYIYNIHMSVCKRNTRTHNRREVLGDKRGVDGGEDVVLV